MTRQGLRKMKRMREVSLYLAAVKGDHKALARLYELNEPYWSKIHPVGFSRLMTFDDWTSLAKEEFFSQWRKFDPTRKTLFTSWMFGVVRNSFLNEIIRLKAKKRGGGVEDFSFEDIEYLSFEEFVCTNDTMVLLYFDSFERYLKQQKETDDLVLKVFQLKKFKESLTDTRLSVLCNVSIPQIKASLNFVKCCVKKFVEQGAFGYEV